MSCRFAPIRCLLALVLLLAAPLFLSAEEELYVELSSQVVLLPTYICPIEVGTSELSKNYWESIARVLAFDLANNGKMQLREAPIKGVDSSYESAVSFDLLRNEHLAYLIRLRAVDNELQLKLISVDAEEARVIDQLFMNGNLAQDRRKVHRLADTVASVLFGVPGIASQRMLFSVKKKGSKAGSWISEVYEADYDGHNARSLTHDQSLAMNPQYIPQEGRSPTSFLYVSHKIGQPKIFRARLAGGAPRRVTPIRGNQLTPSLTPDGSQLAFTCDVSGTTDLFSARFHADEGAIGKPRQIFAAKGAAEASPTFSPDGKKIAFVSDKDGSAKVYLMDVPEGKSMPAPRLITKRCRENSAPAWSPDGKKIAYSAKTTGLRQIWVYDVETGKEYEITHGDFSAENPAWAPNSVHLLFNAENKAGTELYLINIYQKLPVKITSGEGEKRFPSWEPWVKEPSAKN